MPPGTKNDPNSCNFVTVEFVVQDDPKTSKKEEKLEDLNLKIDRKKTNFFLIFKACVFFF